MTRIEQARQGTITDEFRQVAAQEGMSPETLVQRLAEGTLVIPINPKRTIQPIAIGLGCTTKVNANIGTSKDSVSLDTERAKLDILVRHGADAVMDLSTGGPIRELREMILSHAPIAVGTVPIYETVVRTAAEKKTIAKMTADDLFDVIEEHGQQGVDFVTVHTGLTLKAVERLRSQGRVLDIVSRGGSFLLEWMVLNEKENPLTEQYDRLLEIAKRYDMTLSLGDGLRPGCLEDATDRSQIEELLTLGEQRDLALEAGVQVMIEGPGHVPLNQVELNIRLQKEVCKGAPFYVLGPLVTDVAMGYDHIAAAIGGAVAASAGADFLCYVTPAEHIRLPGLDDVKEGVIASKIAAHAADIAKGLPGAIDKDIAMARCRNNLDWKGQIGLSIDPDKARRFRDEGGTYKGDACSMCGSYCAIKVYKKATLPSRCNND